MFEGAGIPSEEKKEEKKGGYRVYAGKRRVEERAKLIEADVPGLGNLDIEGGHACAMHVSPEQA